MCLITDYNGAQVGHSGNQRNFNWNETPQKITDKEFAGWRQKATFKSSGEMIDAVQFVIHSLNKKKSQEEEKKKQCEDEIKKINAVIKKIENDQSMRLVLEILNAI